MTHHAEKTGEALKQRFGFLDIKVPRERRVFATTPLDKFLEVLSYAQKELCFSRLCTITGLDEGDNLSAYYHISHVEGTVLNLKTSVLKANPKISTISDFFPAAVISERELVDLFGFVVEGIPPGKRYPLPDGWPEGQYPLRKDWKPEMLGDKTFSMEGSL